MIYYQTPKNWIKYDMLAVATELVEAKSVVLALQQMPYQRSWVEALQQIQLKREVAGTSRIEGAEFTDRELDDALKESPEQLQTRAQRQAHAASQAYRWMTKLRDDLPLNRDLICEIHRRIVSGADDDHCPPGQIRQRDENVNFGTPRHRGAEGGDECNRAFEALAAAIQHEFREHDPLIQALGAHYHLAAMHPFLDGNGRTARALEALVLQRAGVGNICLIPMSNYYNEEKAAYLTALNASRAGDHDLTSFLTFGLGGIARQGRQLLGEIKHEVSKDVFRSLMYDFFTRLVTPHKRVIAERQIAILKLLLDHTKLELAEMERRTSDKYKSLGNPRKALMRDLAYLSRLGAVEADFVGDNRFEFRIRMRWPTEITQTEFFKRVKRLPKTKTHSFLP